jgi:hypothetical protein
MPATRNTRGPSFLYATELGRGSPCVGESHDRRAGNNRKFNCSDLTGCLGASRSIKQGSFSTLGQMCPCPGWLVRSVAFGGIITRLSMAQRTCVDCTVISPEVDSQYTLIKDGWRVVRGQDAGSDWRCSSCWAQYKGRPSGAQRIAPAASSSAPPPGSGSLRAVRGRSSDKPATEAMTSNAAPESPRRQRP